MYKDINIEFVTPSIWLKEIVKQSFFNDMDIHVINNGVDTSIFKKRNYISKYMTKLNGKNIILGVAMIWDERKGLEDFIELASLLNENEHIVLVGLDNKQIQKLPNGITGINRTNNQIELAEIYSSSNVFFNPTYDDNFPTTNLEAASCGLPIITYNTGGSIESVQKDKFIINQGDLTAALSAIRGVFLNLNEDFSRVFSDQVQCKKYYELYSQ